MKVIRMIFEFIGIASLSIVAHEAYHWFTVDHPVEMCIDRHGAITRYVGGYTSEIVAYSITLVIVFIGVYIMVVDNLRR
jgi:hypothetical protein